jgi:hypothetical protein
MKKIGAHKVNEQYCSLLLISFIEVEAGDWGTICGFQTKIYIDPPPRIYVIVRKPYGISL